MAESGKLMNFITEDQVEEIKKLKGESVDDGTTTVDRPLYEILQEQKEKKAAEEKEKFRNLPPKGLDEEEMEFLQSVEQHKKEVEQEAAKEEQEAMTQFQTALLSRTVRVDPKQPAPGNASNDQAGSKRKLEQQQQQQQQKEKDKRKKTPFVPAFKVGVKVQPKKPKGPEQGQQERQLPRGQGSSAPAALQQTGTGSGVRAVRLEGAGAGAGAGSEGSLREPSGGPPSGSGLIGLGGSAVQGKHPGGAGGKDFEPKGLSGLLAYGGDSDDDVDDESDDNVDNDRTKNVVKTSSPTGTRK